MNRKTYIVEKFIGMIHGRAIVKTQEFKHNILTKRIIEVDVIQQTFKTRDSEYVMGRRDVIMTTQDLFDIYNDIEHYKNFGCNCLEFIRSLELEKPNEHMKSCFG